MSRLNTPRTPKYSKPQTLDDYRPYRLSDLFAFFDVPEGEQAAYLWVLEHDVKNPNSNGGLEKIGREWWLSSQLFISIYRCLKQNGAIDRTVEELEAKHGKA